MSRRLAVLALLCFASMAPGIYNDPPRDGVDLSHGIKKPFTVGSILIARVAQDFGINLYG